jgi:hypothetical protein
MRKYNQVVEFANFICHFESKVLLDYLEEIVLPAFLQGRRVRSYGESRYLLLDVELINISSYLDERAVPAIVGRFVLDTELRRDQILVEGRIVNSEERLPSAPSSLFVLLLRDHKLIYAKQVAGAPGLSAFRTTIEMLLKSRRSEYIHEIFLKNKAARELDPEVPLVTKRSLAQAIPAPSLQVVPMAGSKNLEDFVKQFKLLKEVHIKVVRPNAEINNNKLFGAVEAARAQVNADATSLVHRNPDGLNKTQSIKQIAPAMDGNALVTLRGTGANDAKLSGTNDEISVKEPLDIPPGVKKGTLAMYNAFVRLLRAGVLKVGQGVVSRKNQAKLERLQSGK